MIRMYFMKTLFLSNQCIAISEQCNHSRLAEIPTPDGSQEVVVYTHRCSLLIGQYLPACWMGPQTRAVWVLWWSH